MTEPIQSIFASGTNNKLQLTESQISSGIKYQGAVVSNELNAQFNRTDLAIDELQRTVGFYNNKRKYVKWDLAKILVNYNGVYGIVTLAWNNVESNNQPPFIEVESTPSLEFTYNYNNTTPMLVISTESKKYFELRNFLNSQFWDIVGMSENFQNIQSKLGSKIQTMYSQVFYGTYTYNNYNAVCQGTTTFNLLDCDYITFGTFKIMYSLAQIRAFIDNKIYIYSDRYTQVVSTESSYTNKHNLVEYANFNNWDLEKNKVYFIRQVYTSTYQSSGTTDITLYGFKL